MSAKNNFIKVGAKSLFVSEPNPMLFGNPKNPSNSDLKKLHWTNQNWLKSRFHFSFAEYRDSERSNFGVVRVLNDDLVQPKRGFGAHPHRNMEICTYIINGELTHKDSMGTAESLGRGSVQFMTAGTGVRHSEQNKGNVPVRFIQIWINPRSNGLKPNYGSSTCKESERKNQWYHMVSDVKAKNTKAKVQINQDANIFVAEMDTNKTLEFEFAAKRQGYLVCMEGAVNVKVKDIKDKSIKLEKHDALQIKQCTEKIIFETTENMKSHLLLIEMSI